MIKKEKHYKKIRRMPLRYIPQMTLAFFSINVLTLVLPLTMKKIYGSVIVTGSEEVLRYVLMLALLALALEAVMRKVKETSSKWIASKYEYQLSTLLINKLFKGFNHGSDQDNYISNMEKFKSIGRLTSFYATAYYQLLIDVPFAGLFLYLIYIYGGLIVLIPMVLSLVYIGLVLISSNHYFKSQSTYVKNNDLVMSQLIETLEKIHYIKAAGLEESQINTYKKRLDDLAESEYISNKYKAIPSILGSKISQLSLFMTMIAGGYFLAEATMSFGEITACAMLSSRAISPIISLMKYYQQTKDMKIIRKRIEEIAYSQDQYGPDVPNFPEDINGAIELIDLQYKDMHLGGDHRLNQTIGVGDFVVIDPREFPSYRGILDMVAGRTPILQGRILIDNLDVSQWNMHSLKGRIEYLNQDVSIFKGSVLDNITYFNPGEIKNAFEAAKVTGLADIVSKMPEGFASEIDSQMINYLSAAFVQRLNLTRALLERPRLLIFDRIDENMDSETLEVFKWLLGNLKGHATIIVVTWHDDIYQMGDYHLQPTQAVR